MPFYCQPANTAANSVFAGEMLESQKTSTSHSISESRFDEHESEHNQDEYKGINIQCS